MSTWPAVSAQKSGEPTQASTSPVALSSTTAAAWLAPRSARVSTVCRTSASSASCSARSSDVRTGAPSRRRPARSSQRAAWVVKCGGEEAAAAADEQLGSAAARGRRRRGGVAGGHQPLERHGAATAGPRLCETSGLSLDGARARPASSAA